MLTWTILSKTDQHEILVAEAPEGRWTISKTCVESLAQITLLLAHPTMNQAEAVLALLAEEDPAAKQALRKFTHPQTIGKAGSLEEAKVVAEMFHDQTDRPTYDELVTEIGYTVRHTFENERGEFRFLVHPSYKSVELVETPEGLHTAYEGRGGSDHIVIINSESDLGELIAYPAHTKEAATIGLLATEEILRRRAAAGSYRKPL